LKIQNRLIFLLFREKYPPFTCNKFFITFIEKIIWRLKNNLKKNILFLIYSIFLIIGCENNPIGSEKNPDEENHTLKLEIEIIDAGVSNVRTVSISNNNQIAWGGSKHDIKVLGKSSLKGHIGTINSLDFSKNGQLLLSGSGDHNIKIWNVNSGLLLKTFSQHLTITRDTKFTPDGESVISAENEHIVYWRNVVIGNTGKLLFLGHTKNILSIDIDKTNNTVISGSADATIKLWDANTGVEMKTLDHHNGTVYEVEFSPLGHQFASCSSDSTILIWGVDSHKIIQSLEGHEGVPKTINYHPSGNFLACGSSNSKIYIWDLNTFLIVNILEGHTSIVTKIDFSDDGNRLISGASDDKVIIWKNILVDQNY
jgi:WD40 repeat protein